jgi:isobutyryl-CoA mutase
MNSIHHPRVYMRSLATRESNLSLSRYVQDAIDFCRAAKFDLVIVETSGIGQSDTEITQHADASLYVMTSEYGAATQLEKIDMLDFADVIALNKFDKPGSLDALRDIRKQYRRNNELWDAQEDSLPVVGTIASQFNDPGMNELYQTIMKHLVQKGAAQFQTKTVFETAKGTSRFIIPPEKVRYLAEISEITSQ